MHLLVRFLPSSKSRIPISCMHSYVSFWLLEGCNHIPWSEMSNLEHWQTQENLLCHCSPGVPTFCLYALHIITITVKCRYQIFHNGTTPVQQWNCISFMKDCMMCVSFIVVHKGYKGMEWVTWSSWQPNWDMCCIGERVAWLKSYENKRRWLTTYGQLQGMLM